jgi:soluble lytic murein transglycosylase-like protein
MKRLISLIFSIVILITFVQTSLAQKIYKYVDNDGVQVFTNIPPVDQISEMEVTGTPEQVNTPTPSARNSNNFDTIINKHAVDYNLDPALIKAIIATESGFNPNAVSPKGARGLMQLMPATAASLGVTDSFDPDQNIKGGVKHFRSLMNNFRNNLTLSLAAYNAGENLVQRLGRVPDFKETREYVKSIKRLFNKSETNYQVQEQHQPVLKFFDNSGTLNLTNIPPMR